MKQIIKNIDICKYDIDTVKNAFEKFMKLSFSKNKLSKESVLDLISELEKILMSFEYSEKQVTVDIKETEEEAMQYFGKKFIMQFEQIREYCMDNNLLLAIHGIKPQNISALDSILAEGLKYDRPELDETACIQIGKEQEEQFRHYSDLLNWKHCNSKKLVLLGIPKECNRKPLWTNISTDTQEEYMIKSEFIIGTIDVEEGTITINPHFTLVHNYENLINDMFLSKFGYSIDFDTEQTSNYIKKTKTNVDSGEVDQLLDVAQTNLNNSLGHLSGRECKSQLNEKGYINEEDIHMSIDVTRETIMVLEKAVPFLQSNCEILNELESFNNGYESTLKIDEKWDESSTESGDLDLISGSFLDDIEEDIKQDSLDDDTIGRIR